jgi:hypothetical protein
VARALAVELASTEVDVGGAVAVDPRLRDKASRASIAGVKSNRLKNGEHFAELVMAEIRDFIKVAAGNIEIFFKLGRNRLSLYTAKNDFALFLVLCLS